MGDRRPAARVSACRRHGGGLRVRNAAIRGGVCGRLPAADGAQVSHLNIGCGEVASIRELSELVQAVVGFEGKVMWDSGKPDGMPCKLLDVSRLNRLGWRPQIGLDQGIRSVYTWYLKYD